jgi:hypothetical protein
MGKLDTPSNNFKTLKRSHPGNVCLKVLAAPRELIDRLCDLDRLRKGIIIPTLFHHLLSSLLVLAITRHLPKFPQRNWHLRVTVLSRHNKPEKGELNASTHYFLWQYPLRGRNPQITLTSVNGLTVILSDCHPLNKKNCVLHVKKS